MKRITLITLSLCFIAISTWSAPTATKRTKQPGQAVQTYPEITKSINESAIILSEDFSKFTSGNEIVPGEFDLTDPYTGRIESSYTHIPGWNGEGIFQAGGKAYIGICKKETGDSPGFIITPLFDASYNSGKYTIKFKARSANPEGNEMDVYWNYSIGNGGYDYDGETIVLTNEWEEFTLEATNGNNSCYVDFYPQLYACYIDDIEIIQEGGVSDITTPKALPATNIGESGFTANWQVVNNATAYLLSVYSYETTGSSETIKYLYEEKKVESTSFNIYYNPLETQYYYKVKATNGTETSEYSEEVKVAVAGSSVNNTMQNAPIYIKDKQLHVVIDRDEMIEVFTISGAKITQMEGKTGDNIVHLPQQGIYLVKIGKDPAKVVR